MKKTPPKKKTIQRPACAKPTVGEIASQLEEIASRLRTVTVEPDSHHEMVASIAILHLSTLFNNYSRDPKRREKWNTPLLLDKVDNFLELHWNSYYHVKRKA